MAIYSRESLDDDHLYWAITHHRTARFLGQGYRHVLDFEIEAPD